MCGSSHDSRKIVRQHTHGPWRACGSMLAAKTLPHTHPHEPTHAQIHPPPPPPPPHLPHNHTHPFYFLLARTATNTSVPSRPLSAHITATGGYLHARPDCRQGGAQGGSGGRLLQGLHQYQCRALPGIVSIFAYTLERGEALILHVYRPTRSNCLRRDCGIWTMSEGSGCTRRPLGLSNVRAHMPIHNVRAHMPIHQYPPNHTHLPTPTCTHTRTHPHTRHTHRCSS